MKFKAFTLLELIIASLITGIIGFIIVYFIQDVVLVTKGQHAAQQQEEDVAIFDLLLTNDLFLSDTFYFVNGNFEIIKNTKKIHYEQNNTEIKRIELLDTTIFYLPIEIFRLNNTNKHATIEVAYNLSSELVQAIYIDEADYLK